MLDIDECEENSNNLTPLCDHNCQNFPGSYICSCNPGYRLISSETHPGECEDINECLLNNGHGPCQDTCHNIIGGYECSCETIPGTKLSEDDHECVPGDACVDSGCSHECLSARGDAFCLCPVGMRLGDDWKTCEGINFK